jgi:esterase/lipase superfamily enzyme
MRGIPRTFELSVRINDSGGEVAAEVKDVDRLLGSGSRHILLLVHGYNNSRNDADESYQIFIDNILPKMQNRNVTPDAIAKFQWPGDESTVFGTTVGYPFDINHALVAATRLATFLKKLPIPNQGAASVRVTFVGHSMGCRLILEALGRMTSGNVPGIEVVGLMAAASPVDFVKRSGRLFATGNPPRQMLKFCSEQDLVLQFGFPLGEWLAYQYQIENNNYSEAIGRYGHPDEFGARFPRPNGHSDYWKDQTVVDIVLKTIDATLPTMLPQAEIAERSLPPENEIAERNLPRRTMAC